MGTRLVIAALLLAVAACSPATVQEPNPPTTAPPTTAPVTTSTPPAHETTSAPSTTMMQQQDARLDFTYGARENDLSVVDALWVGLPPTVERVMIEPVYADFVEERKIDGAVTFQFTKPEWTSYLTFTAYDADGTVIASEEAVIDGSGCSARSHRPGDPDAYLPDSVEATRMQLLEAAEQCLFGAFEDIAASDGEYFGFDPSELGVRMRELDWRYATMDDIRRALQLRGRLDEQEGSSVYVFDAGDVEILIGDDGRWIGASI